MGVANVPAASAAGLQPKYQKFTSSGTFTLPTGYGVSKPLLINIQVIGGGGAGATGGANGNFNFLMNNSNNFNWNAQNYFGNNGSTNGGLNSNAAKSLFSISNSGGSGGVASGQMYLTSNLTITVGAGGTRAFNNNQTFNYAGANTHNINSSDAWTNYRRNSYNPITLTGNSGGTSTAGVLSATGGSGGSGTAHVYSTPMYSGGTINVSTPEGETSGTGNGSGGQPGGTSGGSAPLLFAIAGGSTGNTPIYGSYGIGGIGTDQTTSTGTDGSGGGTQSVAANGAVIITWWE